MIRNGIVSCYHFDGLGSTRLLTYANGSITDTYEYDAFGGSLSQSGTTENYFLFTGQQYDPQIGFYYLRERYYGSNNGRFSSVDSYQGNFIDPKSLNDYVYAADDPINQVDPSGESFVLVEQLNMFSLITTLAKSALLAAAATCGTLYTAGSVAGSGGGDISSMPGGPCLPNQMLVHLQKTRSGVTFETFPGSGALLATSLTGVTVTQVEGRMMEIFLGHPGWFPDRLEPKLHGAIMYLSTRIRARQAGGGVSQGGHIESAEIPDKVFLFHMDIVNLRGHNLKFL